MGLKIVWKSLWLLGCWFWLSSQIVQAACTETACDHDIFIHQSGFYIASMDIAQQVYAQDDEQQPYFWSLSVLTSDGTNQGGFHTGLTLSNHLLFNGFMAFYLQQAEVLAITPFRYTGDAEQFTLTLLRQDINGNRVTEFELTEANTGELKHTPLLPAGFYILEVKANNQDETIHTDQMVGISINANHMVGGVHVGGWFYNRFPIQALSGRFAGFYIAQPQMVHFQATFNETAHAAGMNMPIVKLYRQAENNTLEPYFSASDTTLAVSTNATEQLGNHQSHSPAVSHDGRYVAFASMADNLVDNDDNGLYDIFVKDVQTGHIERVSVGTNGQSAHDYVIACSADAPCIPSAWHGVDSGMYTMCADSLYPAISGDGRYVSFISAADFGDSEDTNNLPDLFVHDRQTGETQRIALNLGHEGRRVEGNVENVAACQRFSFTDSVPYILQDYQAAAMSNDGQWIAFNTAEALIAEDSNAAHDVYVYQRDTEILRRVSVDSNGLQAEPISVPCETYWPAACFQGLDLEFVTVIPHSRAPSISRDGRFIAFVSQAATLVNDDSNLLTDVFVHDQQTGETRRVSVSTEGQQAARYLLPCSGGSSCIYSKPGVRGDSKAPSISADGRYVAFSSTATNLIADYNSFNRKDVYVHDRLTGVTEIVSMDSNGQLSAEQGQTTTLPGDIATIGSDTASISADGRYVLFLSTESMFDAGKQNINSGYPYLFLRDRERATTQRLVPFNTLNNDVSLSMSVLSADAVLMAFQRRISQIGNIDIDSQVYVMTLQ